MIISIFEKYIFYGIILKNITNGGCIEPPYKNILFITFTSHYKVSPVAFFSREG